MPLLTKYFVVDFFDDTQYTAGIVVKDNEKILAGEGFIPLRFRQYTNGSIYTKIRRLKNAFTLSLQCKKNSLVIFHFPMHSTVHNLLHYFLQWRGTKTAAIIIDIDGIRDKNEQLLQDEIVQLSKFNYLVAHNDSMKEFLLHYLPAAKIFTIGLFDYPVNNPVNKKLFSSTVCIAANFLKAKYIYQLNKIQNVYFNAYGNGFDPGRKKECLNISYKGIVLPDELPAKMEGSFGLVWDGDSSEKCDEYLRYNNPHKLSLYLVAGLPVIVWKDSAVAKFVEENKIGITINSIVEIEKELTLITNEQYVSMQQNTVAYAEKLQQGYYLKTVLKKIIATIPTN